MAKKDKDTSKTFELRILWWKYYSEFEENRKIHAKQARRVEERFETLEGTGHEVCR
jgi:hypothetical protein